MTAGIGSKRALQKVETRLRIVEVAQALIAERGISGLKTLDVAVRAGLSHGAIFVHFATREELLSQVIEAFGTSLNRQIHAAVEGRLGLETVLAAHLEELQKNESFYTALVEERKLLPQPAKETLIAIQSAVSFHIYQAAEAGIQSGAYRPIPPHLLFNTWLGLIHYYLSHRDLFAPSGSVLQEKGGELLTHFMKLVNLNQGERYE